MNLSKTKVTRLGGCVRVHVSNIIAQYIIVLNFSTDIEVSVCLEGKKKSTVFLNY